MDRPSWHWISSVMIGMGLSGLLVGCASAERPSATSAASHDTRDVETEDAPAPPAPAPPPEAAGFPAPGAAPGAGPGTAFGSAPAPAYGSGAGLGAGQDSKHGESAGDSPDEASAVKPPGPGPRQAPSTGKSQTGEKGSPPRARDEQASAGAPNPAAPKPAAPGPTASRPGALGGVPDTSLSGPTSRPSEGKPREVEAEELGAVAPGPPGPPPVQPDRRPPSRGAADGSGPDDAAPAGPETVTKPEPSKPEPAEAEAPEAAPLQDAFKTLDDFIAQARQGRATFTAPDSIKLEQEVTATLVLDPATTESSGPAATGEVKVEGVARLSPKMKAVLTGSGFTITSGQSDVQAVSLREPTEWHWQLKPAESGEQRLTVTLSAIVKVDDEATERLIKTFDRTVMVRVSPMEAAVRFATEHLEMLVGSLLVPLAGWAWTVRSGNRQDDRDA